MGRKKRPRFPGAADHLPARVNHRPEICLDDPVRRAFREMLVRAGDGILGKFEEQFPP